MRLAAALAYGHVMSVALVSAWTTSPALPSLGMRSLNSQFRQRTSLRALDYNDPMVAEEFNNVQPMTWEEVEEELKGVGIPLSQTANDMEAKMILVEMRLRLSGKLGGKAEKKRPDKFSSKFEEFMWTKPVFEEFYNDLKAKGDGNAMNVVAEYVNDKENALQRYGKDYKGLIRKAEAALTAAAPVKSPTVTFKGFPANMGDMGCKMTLEALGPIVDYECTEDEDFPILTGKVTFEDIETARKAIEQYDGMDMGMGTKLEIVSV